jgi:hypothetical protein
MRPALSLTALNDHWPPLRLVRPRRPRGRPEIEWEVVVPAQFFGSDRETKRHQQPEVRLMHAVLVDTLAAVFERAAAASPRLRAETLAWFAADDWKWPFSFVNVCQATGVDAARLRQLLSRWLRERREHRIDGTEHALNAIPGGCE